jgi:hypothetical protein
MIGEGGIVVLRGAAFVVEREAGRKKTPSLITCSSAKLLWWGVEPASSKVMEPALLLVC